jgi:putative membrane protein
MMWGDHSMSAWAWGFGILVLVGVVLVVFALIRMLAPAGPTSPPGDTTPTGGAAFPKQILDERYARGELTTEEYRERLAALGLDV